MTMQKKLMFTLFLATCLAGSGGVSAQDEGMERYTRSTWRMTINLETPNLVPPAVQWTVVDKDPIPGFEARVKSMQSHYGRQSERAKNGAEREIARLSQMTVSWDFGFKEVSGDNVYLLTSAPGVSNGFSSNAPDGKKWIVTKIVGIKGKPVCWCIPITVETGREIQVTLTEDNMFDLESTYNKAMEKSIRDE